MYIPYNYINKLKLLDRQGREDPPSLEGTDNNIRKTLSDVRSANEKTFQAINADVLNIQSLQKEILLRNQELGEDLAALGTLEFADKIVKQYYKIAKATEVNKKSNIGLIQTGAQLQIGINKLIGSKEALGKRLITAAKASTALEQRNKSLNKTFGIGSLVAAKLGEKYDAVASAFGEGGMNIRQYAQSLNAILPLQAKNIANTLSLTKVEGNYAEALSKVQQAAADGIDYEDLDELTRTTYEAGEQGVTLSENAATAQEEVNRQLFETQTFFQKNLGLSGELANKFILFAATAADGAVGAADVAAQLTFGLNQSKEMSSETGVLSTVMQDVANLSSDVALQFSQTPKLLGMAALKARALGTNLGEVYSIGKNLLNIETSVGNELEYQLLSGKRLIGVNGESLTQKFREATLSGSAIDQAQTLNEIIESQGDTISTNFMARKKLAETLGIGEDKLARMVQQRELLQDLGPEAENILTLEGEKLNEAVEKFTKLEKEDPRRKKFEEVLAIQANTLTTDEKMLYYLEEIATAQLGEQVRLAGTNQFDIIQSTMKGFAGTDADSVEAAKSQLSTSMNIVEDNFFGGGKTGRQTLMQTLSSLGTFAEANTVTGEGLKEIGKLIPVLGQFAETMGSKMSDKGLTFSGIKTVNMSTSGPITLSAGSVKSANDVIATTKVNDAILFDPNDQIGIVASTSRDGFANGIDAVSGGNRNNTNTTTISEDSIRKLAMAMIAGMKNININVPTDIFGESKMNIRSIGG